MPTPTVEANTAIKRVKKILLFRDIDSVNGIP
jgi:hypothetical protein